MINEKQIIKLIDELRIDHRVPAIQVGIIKDDKIVFCGGSGFSNIDKEMEADEDTVFPIASDTKAFVAEAIGILVDEGKVEFDKTVKSYIPEFEMFDSYVTQNLTVRDMLSHRCGLPGHDFMFLLNLHQYSREHIMKAFKYLKPSFPFRYKMQYQNHMFGLAGYLIERVTGQKWSEFVRERITEPLEMTSTNFSIGEIKGQENRALPYQFINEEVTEMPYDDISEVVGAAGSMNSNIKDMLKWVRLNLNRGQWEGKCIISGNSIDQCHKPQTIVGDMRNWKFSEIAFQSYGLGWFAESYRGHRVVHHSGSIQGFCSMVSFIPEINAGFVILTNRDCNRTPSILQYSLYDMLLGYETGEWSNRFKKTIENEKTEYEEYYSGLIDSSPKNTEPSLELNMYEGMYRDEAYGEIEIMSENNKLVFKSTGLDLGLDHLCYDTFLLVDHDRLITIPLQFKKDVSGTIVAFEMGCEPELREGIEFKKQ